MRIGITCFCLLGLSLPAVVSGNPTDGTNPTPEELEKWFEDDTPTPETNLGELNFLSVPPAGKTIHHHQNQVRITTDSLKNAWAGLIQCHKNLDKVGSLQITFREGYIRNLQVTETRNIEKAWVEGPTVQLKNIGENAKICLQAESRAFTKTGDGFYTLNNGPYMRKFLDGYFPMQVSMRVSYPASLLQVVSITPDAQPSFKVTEKTGEISFDALFEGELRTSIQFQQTAQAARE